MSYGRTALKLEILFQNENYVAVNKPSGLLVHRTQLSSERENCMALLRDQLGQWVYPVHRLDRATSGVLIFALSSEAAREMSALYSGKSVRKTYYAIVRGYMPEEGVIDRPLREDETKERVAAVSSFKLVEKIELPFAVSKKHPTSRYSLVRVETSTGRLHQVRKHLAGVFHPIVGDTTHGDGRHNTFFREQFGVHRLLLHAREVDMPGLNLVAPWPPEFIALAQRFGWTTCASN